MNRVVIVLASCQQTGNLFGIRFEEMRQGNWMGTWAFKIKEEVAHREGYDRTKITGSFNFGDDYPGCPYCKNLSLFKCSCGKVSCWDGNTMKVFCRSCQQTLEISSEALDSLDAGVDR